MTPTYFMQDRVNPKAKITSIQAWRPSRFISLPPALTAPYGAWIAHASGYADATRAGWKSAQDSYPPTHDVIDAWVADVLGNVPRQKAPPTHDVETDMALGFLEVQIRRGIITDTWVTKFVGDVSRQKAPLTDTQKNKIDELYARYGGKK